MCCRTQDWTAQSARQLSIADCALSTTNEAPCSQACLAWVGYAIGILDHSDDQGSVSGGGGVPSWCVLAPPASRGVRDEAPVPPWRVVGKADRTICLRSCPDMGNDDAFGSGVEHSQRQRGFPLPDTYQSG